MILQFYFFDLVAPHLKLIGDVVIKFERRTQTDSCISYEFNLQELPFVYLLHDVETASYQLVSFNWYTLTSNLFDVVLFMSLSETALLLDILPEEEYGSMDVN